MKSIDYWRWIPKTASETFKDGTFDMNPLLMKLVVVLLACCVLVSCEKPPAEQQLRQQLQVMQKALEKKSPDVFLDNVADDYSDKQGGDIQSLKKLLLFHMIQNQKIGVYLANIQVTVTGQTAELTMQAGLTGGSERLLPDRARLYRVITRWRQASGDWLLYYAEWEPV
jgi:hypothetical protein